jgi:hypothetical protein
MGLRRLLGLLMTLMTANLAFASSDLVCDKHTSGHHAAPNAPMPSTDHHGGTGPEKDPCNIPSRSDCCHGVTSCAPSLSLVSVVVALDELSHRSVLPRSIDEVPLTRRIPPDPPPPKV